ncbi:thioredoxin family protein [Candidatus Electronema sp. PJ]|uniref:thioredoxin family protein n=1 Tax=Candidatus Electronema sp. PJ TaxID=3401572 RepID=UPI003AA8ECE4
MQENTFQPPIPAASRFIRIGKASIGLIGLDIALNAAARQQLAEQEAAKFLFTQIKEHNYIPSGCAEQYQQALLEAYQKHCGREARGQETGLVIRIFGTGCVSCNRLYTLLIELLDRLGLAADVEQVYDPDEIGRAGVTMTPTLMINGTIKSAGHLPLPAQVEQWLRECA